MNKNNNFDFLRFLFAILVLISHAYGLLGVNDKDNLEWIYEITNGQMCGSSIGLNGFFVISGFFIFKSLQRSRNLKEYFLK